MGYYMLQVDWNVAHTEWDPPSWNSCPRSGRPPPPICFTPHCFTNSACRTKLLPLEDREVIIAGTKIIFHKYWYLLESHASRQLEMHHWIVCASLMLQARCRINSWNTINLPESQRCSLIPANSAAKTHTNCRPISPTGSYYQRKGMISRSSHCSWNSLMSDILLLIWLLLFLWTQSTSLW